MKKLGLIFANIAFLIAVVSNMILLNNGSVEPFGELLLYFGFALPIQFGMFFKVLDGCGLKDAGCEGMSYVGGFFGLLAVTGIYYFVGWGFSLFFRGAPPSRGKPRRR